MTNRHFFLFSNISLRSIGIFSELTTRRARCDGIGKWLQKREQLDSTLLKPSADQRQWKYSAIIPNFVGIFDVDVFANKWKITVQIMQTQSGERLRLLEDDRRG